MGMSINVIARGIVFNFVLNMITTAFLIHYQFELSEKAFTLLLITNLFLICLHTGASSERFAEINGFFVGLVSISMLVIFLSQFVNMDWEINIILMLLWCFVGFIGGSFGSKMKRKTIRLEKLVKAKL